MPLTSLDLAKSEHFIKTVASALLGLAGYWDKDLRCRFANKAYQEWFGKMPEVTLGLQFNDLLETQLFEACSPHIRAALARISQEFEQTLIKANSCVGHTLVRNIPARMQVKRWMDFTYL